MTRKSLHEFALPPGRPERVLFNVGLRDLRAVPILLNGKMRIVSTPKPLAFHTSAFLRGYWTRYPTYCLVAWALDGHPWFHELLALKHLLFLAHREMIEVTYSGKTPNASSVKDYGARLNESFRAFRQLVDRTSKSSTLPFPSAVDHADCVLYLRALLRCQSSIPDHYLGIYDGFRRAFEAAVNHAGGNKRLAAPSDDAAEERARTAFSMGPNGNLGTMLIGRVPNDIQDRETHLRIEPGDSVNRRASFRSPEVSRNGNGTSLRTAMISRRHQALQISRWNQLLPTEWSHLSAADLYAFQNSLQPACALATNKFPKLQVSADELVAHIALQFWLARTASEVCDVRLAESASTLPTRIEHIYLVKDHLQVAFPVYRPPGARRVSAEWQSHVQAVEDSVVVTLPYAASVHLLPYLQRLQSHGKAIFGQDLSAYENLTDVAMKNIRRDTGARVKPTRISSQLLVELTNQCGDLVLATQTLAKPVSDGTISGNYYTATSRARTAELYRDCAARLSSIMTGTSDTTASVPLEGMCGSQVVPTTDFLRNAIARLKNDLTCIKTADLVRRGNVVDIHNKFTSYCVAMLLLMSGCRPIRSPMPFFDALDLATGFILIADKQTNPAHESRLTWLPIPVVEQLEQYRRWRDATIGSAVAKELPFFCTLLNDRRPRPLKTSSLELLLGDHWTVPLNAPRHYFRTALTRAGVPGEIIDAAMGHAAYGREAHSRFSGLSPQDLRRHLAEPLGKMFRDLRWEVIALATR